VVMERTNALHVALPEPVEVVAIDVGWTLQRHAVPAALRNVRPDGLVLSLLKPQYEAPREMVHRGRVDPAEFDGVLRLVLDALAAQEFHVREVIRLPHHRKSKNPEAFLVIRPGDCGQAPIGPPEARWRTRN